jgi:GNAT superfamily N-acetyltransferase
VPSRRTELQRLRRRIDAFEDALAERCADLVEPTAFGTAYLHPAFPQRYSSNFIRIRRTLDAIDADAIAADADRVLGEHDLTHRQLDIHDDANGARLAAGFRELGWSVEPLIHMAQTREPEQRPAVDVVDVDFATASSVIEANLRAQPYGDSEEVIRQLRDFRGVLEREAGARFFVGRVDGHDASVCEAYVLGDVGQVEDVNTLEAFRGRGLASGTVTEASAWARAHGADLVFLVADEEDWPKALYARLGFEQVARFWSFTRTPR